jgi:ubiquinone/menaquinone biosynthesis C-methylase UbiE
VARTHCHAVDARFLPFRDEAFDAVVCCYLLELLSTEDIRTTLEEIRRVLRPRGTFTLVLIGQKAGLFNRIYKVAGSLAPAFWGRQVEERAAQLVVSCNFKITAERQVRQGYYPSRPLTAAK